MKTYEERQESKIKKTRARISKAKKIAEENDLSLYGEEKSGIPMGQPILVGHHSERRHRRHLEKIEEKVRKGYESAKEASRLEDKLHAQESRKAIDSDNPDARELLNFKIQKLDSQRKTAKMINHFIRSGCNVSELAQYLRLNFDEYFADSDLQASRMMESKGFPTWYFTNLGAEVRRLQKRLVELNAMDVGWEPIETEIGKAYVEEGRVILSLKEKPNEEGLKAIKSSPLAFKWSPTNKVWMRKHTATTQSKFFRKCVSEFLNQKGADL